MSTDAERDANRLVVAEAISLASNNDVAALAYLWQVAQSARVLDDMIDGDRVVPAEHIVSVFQGLLIDVHRNGFFNRHREFLLGIHVVVMNAWLDANEWEKSEDKTEQLYAHVLRDLISELIPAVAYLTGGWDRCRAISLKVRGTFKKEI